MEAESSSSRKASSQMSGLGRSLRKKKIAGEKSVMELQWKQEQEAARARKVQMYANYYDIARLQENMAATDGGSSTSGSNTGVVGSTAGGGGC